MDNQGLDRVRGFAWFVFADPGLPASPPLSALPCPAHLWWIEGTETGIRNPVWGDTYLLVTESPLLPPIDPAWVIEPADLEVGFQTDGGEVTLDHLVGVRRTPLGVVQECEFLVAWRDLGELSPPQPFGSPHADSARGATGELFPERPNTDRWAM